MSKLSPRFPSPALSPPFQFLALLQRWHYPPSPLSRARASIPAIAPIPPIPAARSSSPSAKPVPAAKSRRSIRRHYGRVTITHSISITGVEGAGIFRTSAVDAITINAGPNDTINLCHLTLDGFKTASNGIVLNSGGSLTIAHCAVRNFGVAEIILRANWQHGFPDRGRVVSGNGNRGIDVFPQGTGSARGTLDHVSANKNAATAYLSEVPRPFWPSIARPPTTL